MMKQAEKQMNRISEEIAMDTQNHPPMDLKQNPPPENDIFLKISNYCRKRFSHICWQGGISLAFVILLLLILYFLIPDSKTYRLRHTITLPKQDNMHIYPNGKHFHSKDLLSPMVIDRVYNRLNLKEYLSFADFYSSFSIIQDKRKKAKIDAEFAEKFSMKNLKLTDINQLESDYHTALEKNNSPELMIQMTQKTGVWIPDRKAANIMYAIAENWYDIYSKLEARPFPQMESVERMKQVKADLDKGHYLVPLEKARSFSNSILAMCDQLENLLGEKNVCLPTGEYLRDIKERLRILQQYQINVFLSYIAIRTDLRSVFDRIFLIGALEQVENDLIKLNAQGDSVIDALNSISMRSASNNKRVTSGPAQPAAVSLQLDTGFFNSIASLIRNDGNAKLREKYANKILTNRKQCAALETEKIFYQKILNKIDNANKRLANGTSLISRKQLTDMIKSMFDEMFELNEKVIQFRDLILSNYASSDQFYIVDRTVILNAEKILPFKKLTIVLFVLWLFGNFIALTFDFLALKKKLESCQSNA